MAAKESELSLLHSLLTTVFTLDCKTCIDEGIPMATKQNKVRLYIRGHVLVWRMLTLDLENCSRNKP